MSKKIETIIFDMDGTLYQIDGNDAGYAGSTLERTVWQNAKSFIQETEGYSAAEAEALVQEGLKSPVRLGEFLCERYQITRTEYFEIVWNISPIGIVLNFEIAVNVIRQLKSMEVELILLTGAPTVWQQTVLAYLGLEDHFSEIYTADTFKNKKEIFEKLALRFPPSNTLSVGDQLHTDIEPAAEVGLQTLHVKSPNDLETLLTLVNQNPDEKSLS